MADPGGRARVFRVHFDEALFAGDLAAMPAAAAEVARQARERYGTQGVPVAELRRCEDEGRDGTRLAGCVKAYLPAPAGRFGMVLRFAVIDDQLRLAYLAFGVRHHPRGYHAQTVYQLAHRRLHGQPPG
jgi:hypothetical protein